MSRLVAIALAIAAVPALTSAADDYDKPFLGVAVSNLANFTEVYEKSGIAKPPILKAVVIADIAGYGSAAQNGAGWYDIITAIGSQPIYDVEGFKAAAARLQDGKETSLKVYQLKDKRWIQRTLRVKVRTQRQCIEDQLVKYSDDVKDVEFIRHKDTDNVVNRKNCVRLYMPVDNGTALSLRLCICYVADDWLFIEGYSFKPTNEEPYILPVNYFKVKRDNDGGDVWEWIDIAIEDKKLFDTLENMTTSPSGIVRYHGQQYVHDLKLGPVELAQMRTMLDAYKMMGGKQP